jgi:hypothetical protein
MTASGIAGLHLVRFGTAADQGYFLNDFAATYDQIVVNANIVAHMPAAMAGFLAVRAKKPFFIDPQTIAFQHEVDHLLSTSKKSAGEIKRSWQRIIQRYGNPIAKALSPDSPRPILPDDFKDDKECRAFCNRVTDFQNEELSNEFKTGEDAGYVQFLAQEEGVKELVPPSLIVAPYFFLNASFFEEWLNVNLRCLEFTRAVLQKTGNKKPLAAQLVISQEVLLNADFRKRLVGAYRGSRAKPDVFLLWVDSFTEQELSVGELAAYVSLVEELASGGRAVVNLYGGFFSVAAARFGVLRDKLIGVCHGLEYGESKPVVPISGGVPVAKYYLPAVHARLSARVAARAIRQLDGFKSAQSFRQRVCDCTVCRSVIKKDPREEFGEFTETKISTFWRSGKRVAMEFPTAKTSDNCAQHYMWRKYREYLEKTTLKEVCNSLRNGFDELKTPVGLEFVGHCAIWPKVLQGAD